MIEITQEKVMQNWNGEIPLVSISCITYNHEPYIMQTLDGFLMQKTRFPFEVLIHDDASTDRTADIIREYEKKFPKIIKPIYQKENQYSKGNRAILASFVYPRAKGKYIALCEGDDYWIDENKLQKQVDFMEQNPDVGLTYSKVKMLNNKQNEFFSVWGKEKNCFAELIQENQIPTLSVCMRKDILLQYIKDVAPDTKNWLMGDYPMWLYFIHVSKVKFFDEITGVYRALENSASHSTNVLKQINFLKSTYDIKEFFVFFFNETNVDYPKYHDAICHLFIENVDNYLKSSYNSSKYEPVNYITFNNLILDFMNACQEDIMTDSYVQDAFSQRFLWLFNSLVNCYNEDLAKISRLIFRYVAKKTKKQFVLYCLTRSKIILLFIKKRRAFK